MLFVVNVKQDHRGTSVDVMYSQYVGYTAEMDNVHLFFYLVALVT